MSDPFGGLSRAIERFLSAPKPAAPIQPGSGTTVPTEQPDVRLLTPDGAYDLDPHKPAGAGDYETRIERLLCEIRDNIAPRSDPYAVKQRHRDPRKGSWRASENSVIAAANVSQIGLTWRANRRALLIQVPSTATDGVWFRLDNQDATTASPSIECVPGQTFLFDTDPLPDGAVTVVSPTAGTPFTIWEAAT